MELKACAAIAAAVLSLAGHSAARAITFDPFAAGGAGGTQNGQTIAIGAGGGVFELDAFLNIAGQDLNGGFFGTSARLSIDPLPAGLDFAFAPSLSADATDLTLSYSFTNNTGMALEDVTFLSFLDAQIDEPVNGFFNEFAVEAGMLGVERSFEVDEPGFMFGDIFANLLRGSLDGFNALPPGSPDNVSMALSFGWQEAGGAASVLGSGHRQRLPPGTRRASGKIGTGNGSSWVPSATGSLSAPHRSPPSQSDAWTCGVDHATVIR